MIYRESVVSLSNEELVRQYAAGFELQGIGSNQSWFENRDRNVELKNEILARITIASQNNLIAMVRDYAREIRNGRTTLDIHNHLCLEANELSAEMGHFRFLRRFGKAGRWLEHKLNTRFPVHTGVDGIEGEAIDVLTCALDLIFIHNPAMTDEQIMQIARNKLEKWKRRYGQSVAGDRSIH